MSRALSKKPHRLVRRNHNTGTELTIDTLNEREARQRIAFAVVDNLGLTRKEAARHADAVKADGTPYAVETDKAGYTFRLEPGGIYAR